jgi:hypothetical protein
MDRYKTWYKALVELPSWGHKLDAEVLRYLDGCRLVALGSLIWRSVFFWFLSVSLVRGTLSLMNRNSFHTGRYFKSDEGDLVRREQKLWIPENLLAGIDGRPRKCEARETPEMMFAPC